MKGESYMTEIIGIRFKEVGKVYFFSPGKKKLSAGEKVIVETARGVECGEVVIPNRMVEDDRVVQPLKTIMRTVTDADLRTLEENEKNELYKLTKDINNISVREHQGKLLLEELRKTNGNVPTLYDVMLSYQVTKANDRDSKVPYEVEWLPTTTISNGVYVHLHDNDDDGTLNVSYDYQASKYTKQDMANMHSRILHIIEQVLANENCLEKVISDESLRMSITRANKERCNEFSWDRIAKKYIQLYE